MFYDQQGHVRTKKSHCNHCVQRHSTTAFTDLLRSLYEVTTDYSVILLITYSLIASGDTCTTDYSFIPLITYSSIAYGHICTVELVHELRYYRSMVFLGVGNRQVTEYSPGSSTKRTTEL